MLASLFFDSEMSSNDSKKIVRRNLFDDNVLSQRELFLKLRNKSWGILEMLRIRQQIMIKNSQCLLKTINFASRALQPLGLLLEQNDDDGDPIDLPVHVASEL
jgi:hypothetical protein